MIHDTRSNIQPIKILDSIGGTIVQNTPIPCEKIYVGNLHSMYFGMMMYENSGIVSFYSCIESDNEDMSNSNEVAISKFSDDAGNNGQVAIDQFMLAANNDEYVITLGVYDTKAWLRLSISTPDVTSVFTGWVAAIGKNLILPAVLPSETGMETTP